MSFEGKSAIVTGGGSGMGAAIARRLAAGGAMVVIADFDEHNGNRVAEAITADGGTARFVKTDVADPASIATAVQTAVDAYGRLDLAANVAGIAQPNTPIAQTPPEVWDRVNSVNAKGVFASLHAEIPALIAAGGGAIVNFASTGGLSSGDFAGLGAHAASKHAVVGLTKVAALENLAHHVRINAVAPGVIRTPMLAGLSPEEIDAYASSLPAGRLGDPDEVAAVAIFLLSDDASYVNGAVIPVYGGQLVA